MNVKDLFETERGEGKTKLQEIVQVTSNKGGYKKMDFIYMFKHNQTNGRFFGVVSMDNRRSFPDLGLEEQDDFWDGVNESKRSGVTNAHPH